MPYVMSPTYYFAYLQLCISSVLLTRVPLFLLKGCVNPALYLTNTKGATHVPDVGRSSNPIGPRQHLLVVVPAVGVDHLVGVGDQAHPEMQKLNSVTIPDMELRDCKWCRAPVFLISPTQAAELSEM